jgi:hypothetical protein
LITRGKSLLDREDMGRWDGTYTQTLNSLDESNQKYSSPSALIFANVVLTYCKNPLVQLRKYLYLPVSGIGYISFISVACWWFEKNVIFV